MDSTMMDYPLTITTIMRYGTTVFGDKEVVTCAGDEPARRRSYAAVVSTSTSATVLGTAAVSTS